MTTRTLTFLTELREHAQSVETAEVRAENQYAALMTPCATQLVESEDLYVEALELFGQQEEPIERHRREAVEMPGNVEKCRRPVQHSRQVLARSAALRAAPRHVEERDEHQDEARRGPTAQTREGTHHLVPKWRACFRALDPFLLQSRLPLLVSTIP